MNEYNILFFNLEKKSECMNETI